MRTTLITALVAGAAVAFAPLGAAFAADQTITVSKDGDAGWMFNPDPSYSTPYEFNAEQSTIGRGSLYVAPIENSDGAGGIDGRDKFIGALTLGVDAADFEEVAYDFFIDQNTNADSRQFYLNVYANLPGADTFYNCRYDYVAFDGVVGEWTTHSTDEGPTTVTPRDGATALDCGTQPSDMPEGSTVTFMSLNVGDTAVTDQGVAGYYDNVVVSVGGDSTTYDFEPAPASKDDCKKGGFADFGFRNQGQCVAYYNANS